MCDKTTTHVEYETVYAASYCNFFHLFLPACGFAFMAPKCSFRFIAAILFYFNSYTLLMLKCKLIIFYYIYTLLPLMWYCGF